MSNLNEIAKILQFVKDTPVASEADALAQAIQSDKPFETLAKNCGGCTLTDDEQLAYGVGVMNALQLFAAIRDSYTAEILDYMDKKLSGMEGVLNHVDYIVNVTDMLAFLTSKGLVTEPNVK
jgi:hypothetical protein